jgi:hypothetical protein
MRSTWFVNWQSEGEEEGALYRRAAGAGGERGLLSRSTWFVNWERRRAPYIGEQQTQGVREEYLVCELAI